MPGVKFNQGYVTKEGKPIGSDNVSSFHDAMKYIAKDSPGGHDVSLGVETIICATTGEILGRYYTGVVGGPYTQVIEPLETAIANAKALLLARS